ncbi:RsmD family RNA methyltransferase [Hufsiella ginkgonis]|uniref:Methyltransferase domain-containing protein n=1 Tax=Hufsiella ginkgonis TaxID=2695274 RepID=A0A7K1Y2A3_9SPHI|nr:RsmD family RNA methyltransferase [Hufsiella ginkgonis]MXV16806.1 methyltransferase domain-containing protein [Hufsiella ginkgonis]
MRIIGGRLKGLRLGPPANLPVRPTTDQSKEALFNILNNRLDFDGLHVLDLFSGTGNISLEFASRGAEAVTAVDVSYGCVQYLRSMAQKHGLEAVSVFKADVFKYLQQQTGQLNYDLVFADAPFGNSRLPLIPGMVFEKKLVRPGGLLIMEHPSTIRLDHYQEFLEQRKYGYSSFSFFGTLEQPLTTDH